MKCASAAAFLSLLTATTACLSTQPSPMPSVLPCKKCANNMIAVTQAGLNAQQMNGDTVITTGPCLKRTFKCTGTMAAIALVTAGVPLSPITDAGTGIATLTVTCNAAGSGWVANGLVITSVECSAIPPCKQCAAKLIAVTQSGTSAVPMGGGMIDTSGTCAVRPFTCTAPNAFIDINGGSSRVTAGASGAAALTATCNAAGTAWTSQGIDITRLECVQGSCKTCANIPLMTTSGDGMAGGDVIDTTGACATRTLTCNGNNAFFIFSINGVTVAYAGGIPGLSFAFTLNCNAMGTSWVMPLFPGLLNLEVRCHAGNCRTCDASLMTITNSGNGIMTADPITTGLCNTWRFTCTGTNAVLTFSDGASAVRHTVLDAGTGVAVYILVCDVGGAWNISPVFGIFLTQANCAAT